MSKDGRIWLSHTGIEGLERCPRCFWLQYIKGIRQPEGIVSRLANRFDGVLKNYFDSFRGTGELPPMVERINDEFGFLGKLDECLVNEKGELIPVDFKTSSSDPREKELLQAYENQIDDYVFIIKKNNLKVTGYGYLVFVYPDHGKELHNGFPMIIHVVKVKGNPKKTEARIENAMKVLKGKMPQAAEDCKFCKYRMDVRELEN